MSKEMLNPETTLTKCKDGYWLYDKNRGMNLSMRAASEKEALVAALDYYQSRDVKMCKKLRSLEGKVVEFISAIGMDVDDTGALRSER